MRKTMLLVAALTFAVFSSGFAQDSSPANRADIVEKDVARVIGNNVNYTVYDLVNVAVQDGEVFLTGYVTEPYKIDRFIRAIKHELPGIESVHNKVEVLPVSMTDQRLRYILARKIYGDSRLLRYGLSKWPYPIHIIVKNGRVKLEGEVASKLDHRLVESKVRETFGVTNVDNNLDIS